MNNQKNNKKNLKFHIIVFGCQMNYSDAARIKAVMITCGFEITKTIEDADIVIFDTCSVRQKSEDKITGKLREIPKNKKIRISGCMVQHNFRNDKINNKISNTKITGLMKRGNFIGDIKTQNPSIIGYNNNEINKDLDKLNLKQGEIIFINNAYNPLFSNLQIKFKNIELFFRIDDLGFLPLILDKIGYNINKDISVINEYSEIIPQDSNMLMSKDMPTAYIPISTGCNQFCAFCIVPYARGLEKHFPKDQIINEAKYHIQNGKTEIVLIGQIVNKHPEFNEIIKEILKINGLERLRYTSPYPTYYNDELFMLHQDEAKLCPHIHIPIQSGSDAILKKMFRGYNSQQIKIFVDKIRNIKRDISITTDIIVGFPGETKEDFEQTLDIVRYSKFDMIYIGIYSPRPGTYAHQKYKDDIIYKEKHQRRSILNEILVQTAIQNNQKEIGTNKKIIINNIKGNIIEGYTENMKTVHINKTNLSGENKKNNYIVGQNIITNIIGVEKMKLIGKI